MFNFNRRINRRTFLAGYLVTFVACVLAIIIAGLLYGPGGEDNPSGISLIFLAASLVLFFIYTLCLTKQRCNDISNDHAFLLGVVLYVTGFAFILLFIPGENHANQYGPIPKGIQLS